LDISGELIKIGRISGAQGLKGEVKLFHDSGDRERIAGLREIHIKTSEAEDKLFTVLGIRYHKIIPILSLEGVDSRSTAESLIGADVYVDSNMLAPLGDGEYMVSDLIGLNVYDDGMLIGAVTEVLDNPAHDILKVNSNDGRGEILIPLVDVFVSKINIESRSIDVNLPEGL